MSENGRILAQYVKDNLIAVERKLFTIADDAAAIKDKVLIEKVNGLKKAVSETKEYLHSKTDKETR